MTAETRKILDKDIAVQATACGSPSLLAMARPSTSNVRSRRRRRSSESCAMHRRCVVDHRANEGYVTPVECAGEDAVYVAGSWTRPSRTVCPCGSSPTTCVRARRLTLYRLPRCWFERSWARRPDRPFRSPRDRNATDFFADIFNRAPGCPAGQRWRRTVVQRGPIRYRAPAGRHSCGWKTGWHLCVAPDPAGGKSPVIVVGPEFVLFDQMRGKVSVEYPARLAAVPRCVERWRSWPIKLGGVLRSGPDTNGCGNPTPIVEGVGTQNVLERVSGTFSINRMTGRNTDAIG